MSRLPRCSVKEAVEKQICSPEEPPWYNECFISLLPLIWQNERKRWQADIQISKTFWALWSSSGSSDEEWMKIVETRNKSTKQTTQYTLHFNIGLIFRPHCDIFPCTLNNYFHLCNTLGYWLGYSTLHSVWQIEGLMWNHYVKVTRIIAYPQCVATEFEETGLGWAKK